MCPVCSVDGEKNKEGRVLAASASPRRSSAASSACTVAALLLLAWPRAPTRALPAPCCSASSAASRCIRSGRWCKCSPAESAHRCEIAAFTPQRTDNSRDSRPPL
eukprot:5476983-Prymnesium_polylepis.2